MSKKNKSSNAKIWLMVTGLILVPAFSIAGYRGYKEYGSLKSLNWSLGSLKFRLLNVDTTRLESIIQLANGGEVPITVDSINLNVFHKGQRFAEVKNALPLTITEKSQTAHTVFTDLATGNVVDFFKKILDGANTDVDVAGTVVYRAYTTGTPITLNIVQKFDVKKLAEDYISELIANKLNDAVKVLKDKYNLSSLFKL